MLPMVLLGPLLGFSAFRCLRGKLGEGRQLMSLPPNTVIKASSRQSLRHVVGDRVCALTLLCISLPLSISRPHFRFCSMRKWARSF